VKEVLAALDKVERIVADVPPVENGKSRFGNPAFRTFYDAVQSVRPFSPSLLLLELMNLNA
jgi:serine/threonine-protein phosphatase 2A activator